jgi:thiol:disulfide interchange protein
MKPFSRRLASLAAIGSLAAAAFVVSTVAAPAGPPPSGKSIVWQTDFNKALAQAKSQHKLLMVDFYTEG